MYRKKDNQISIDDFLIPFVGYLLADNRWVIKAKIIPWDEIEGEYADLFSSGTGTVAKPARQDELDRIAIEGKFGEGKRRYGLDLIKEKLQETSETTIMINLIVMNLARGYRDLFVIFSKSVLSTIRARFSHFVGRVIPTAALSFRNMGC